MVRQLLFYLTLAIGSISTFPAAARDDAAGGIDVERVPTTAVVGAGGAERRAATARFLCGRIEPAPQGRAVGGGAIGGRARSESDFDLRSPSLARTPNLLPGDYLSSITVYNPNGVAVAVTLRAVATLPVRAGEFVEAGAARRERLPPHQGIEIDCPDVVDLLLGGDAIRIVVGDPSGAAFVGGVVEVETAGPELEVVATQTFRPGD